MAISIFCKNQSVVIWKLIHHADPPICLFQTSAVAESITGEETIPILLIAGPTPGVIPCYISVKRPTIKLFAISTFAALCNMIVRVLSGRFLGCFHLSLFLKYSTISSAVALRVVIQ